MTATRQATPPVVYTVQPSRPGGESLPAVYVFDPPTFMKGRKYTLKGNQELMFRGGQPPRHRRQFVITNRATGNSLQLRNQATGIYDAATEPDDGYCVEVFPQTSITLFTNADIVVRNPSDTLSLSFTIAEIFYA